MGLEVATYIADLVTTNPPTTDLETQGANHLQLIKTVLQNVFGTSVRRVVGLQTTSSTITGNTTLTVNDGGKVFLLSTSGGAITMTLPTLGAGDAGWECSFLKTSSDVNPYFVTPPSGTIQSGEYTGLAKCRRCIPGRRTRVVWTGSAFIAERVVGEPIGAIIPCTGVGKALPAGFEWPNGQVLSSSANYPEYFALIGSGNTIDMRGRSAFGRDDLGGSAANRITVAGGNFDGTVSNGSGGLQNHTQTGGELVSHGHGTTENPHNHGYTITNNNNLSYQGGGFGANSGTSGATTGNSTTGLTINNSGGGNPFTILPPTQIMDIVLVVE